jgi:hypothetical protein
MYDRVKASTKSPLSLLLSASFYSTRATCMRDASKRTGQMMLCTVRVPGIYFEISFVVAHQPLQGTVEKVSYDRSTVYSLCLFVNVAIIFIPVKLSYSIRSVLVFLDS